MLKEDSKRHLLAFSVFLVAGSFWLGFLYFCIPSPWAQNEYRPVDDVYHGAAALDHFLLCDRAQLPEPIKNTWVFDGGSHDGMIYYVSFECESIADCWQAIAAFRAPEQNKFVPDIKTKFAVNQYGPSFYWPEFETPHWDVEQISNGVSYESHQGDRFMDFWAVDLDRKRVYFHHESGGFPTNSPASRHWR